MNDPMHQFAGAPVEANGLPSAAIPPELAEQKDAYVRLAADFDNYKRRTRRDSERDAAAKKEALIHELLPVLDNLELALACDRSAASDSLHSGVEMTRNRLVGVLRAHGVAAVDDVGRPFDARRHEAVAVRREPARPDRDVLAVVQRGYVLGERVFRPAKVIVNDLDPLSEAGHAG